MSFNKENKQPDNSLTQENDPAMANIDISRMDSSGFIKVLPQNKPKRSRTSSRSSSMRGNSPQSQKKEKEIHKSVIQEKANIPPPKNWDEPSIPPEVKDLSTSDIPINDESVVKYESQFPALGEEVPKTEGEFTPEILNPQTIVQTSILKEATDTSSAAPAQEDVGLFQSKASTSSVIDTSHEKHEFVNEWTKDTEPEKVVEIVVPEEKVVEEYQSHFPALGTEVEEVHPQTEFTPEILEAEPKLAAESQGLEVIAISQDKLHIPVENIPVERMREASADRTPKNSETDEQIPSFETSIPSKIPLDQIPSGVAHGLATRRSPSHQDLLKKNLPDEVPATFSGTMKFMETHIPLDEIPSGVAHGFASLRSPSHQDDVKKGLPDEVPATFSGTLESLGEIPPGTAETFKTTHIPLNRISGPISKGFASGRSPSHKEQARQGLPDEVPATFSGTIESFGPQIMGVSKIPLEQIVGGMAKGYNTRGSPSHKDLARENVPDEVPATFTDTVESFEHEFMITPLKLDEIPMNIAMGIEYIKTPTHLDLMKMGLPDEVPATFSAAFALWEESQKKSEEKRQERPSILEQKLESELEQEDQIIENKMSEAHQKFIGKYQRIKQDRDLEKMNDNLGQSWEVIRTNKGDEEIRDHTGYKPARVGEQEEAEGLLSDTDEGVISEEEFGKYSSSAAKNRVEIKEEVPLQSVEENIVISPEGQNEGINMQDLIRKDLKEIERNELSYRGGDKFDDAKLGGEKSSLEHIAEDPNLANRSTELTLSSQRIDLIKEEIKEVIDQAASRDPIFHEVEKDLNRVKELEKSRMYGAAINLLKKSLEILDARLARNDTSFDIREMNKLLIQCNAELAHCYYQVIDYRLSMQYARAVLNLDPRNTEAIYYLGAGQNKTGDFLGGYNTLKEIRRFALPAENDEYLILIESEIQKFEKKVEEGAKKAELGMVSPLVRDLPKSTRTPMEDKKDDASMALSNIGMFVGSGSLAGAASWMLSKNHFKLSEKKTFLYSLGIGALVGTASLALLSHFRKSSNKK